MTKWTPKNGEILKPQSELENEYHKYAVTVERCGERLAKTVLHFLGTSNENCCRVELTGKRVNLGDGKELQIPFIIQFSREAKFVSKLQDILSHIMLKLSIFLRFFPVCDCKCTEDRISDSAFWPKDQKKRSN